MCGRGTGRGGWLNILLAVRARLVDVELLPEATAAMAESIRVGGYMDGLPPMASCMAVKYGHVAAVASSLSVPVGPCRWLGDISTPTKTQTRGKVIQQQLCSAIQPWFH
ncbi:hypothetical protein F7725_012007 [Dissostichus mawsoni]|uniref:Uncharacterized protein n=1 Tax=Dissostichus mawsoni TaxID=36200 RepID=A0A7J5ZAR4_DISMA|nr:hypothetical protein F7725_012007 [Dissostichus mawsoni]